jgi:hypothetical protein
MEIEPLADQGIHGRSVSESVLEKFGVRVWVGFKWLRIWTKVGLL